jgi:plasmid replication initiation protein
MPTHEEHIIGILSEATEPLFASEIAERLNLQLRPAAAYTTIGVVRLLQGLHEQAVQLADGRWMLKRLLRRQSGGRKRGETWQYHFELTAQAAKRW